MNTVNHIHINGPVDSAALGYLLPGGPPNAATTRHVVIRGPHICNAEFGPNYDDIRVCVCAAKGTDPKAIRIELFDVYDRKAVGDVKYAVPKKGEVLKIRGDCKEVCKDCCGEDEDKFCLVQAVPAGHTHMVLLSVDKGLLWVPVDTTFAIP